MFTYHPKKPWQMAFCSPLHAERRIHGDKCHLEIKRSDIPCKIKSPHPAYPWFMKVMRTNAGPRRNNEGEGAAIR